MSVGSQNLRVWLESSSVLGSHIQLSFQPPASPSEPCAISSLLSRLPFKVNLYPKGRLWPTHWRYQALQKPFLKPKSKEIPQNFSLLKQFSPWQLANPFLCFSSKLDKITAENPSCSPPPMRCNPKGEMVSWGPPAVLHLISLLSMV